MSDPLIVFPDIERLIVDQLKNAPTLAGVVVDNRPPAGFDGAQKAVLISRAGGAWVDDQHLDRPIVDIESYGPDKPAAHGVSLAARALALTLRDVVYGGATVLDVVELDGPRWLPDYRHQAASRYVATIQLTVRPA